MKKKIRNDIILALGVVVLAAALFLIFQQGAKSGAWVVVEQNGVEIARLPSGEDHVYEVKGTLGYNLIHIDAQGVRMEDADCPDKLCIYQGAITATNQRIVCLPHRLVVRVVTADAHDLDDMVR